MKLPRICRIITPDHAANHSRPQGRLRAATQSHQSILQTPAGTRQASSAYVVDQAVQVDGGGLLCVHADDVAAGLDEVGHPLLRLHNHPATQEDILHSATFCSGSTIILQCQKKRCTRPPSAQAPQSSCNARRNLALASFCATTPARSAPEATSTMLGAHRTVPRPTCSTALIQSITALQACGRVAGPNRGAS